MDTKAQRGLGEWTVGSRSIAQGQIVPVLAELGCTFPRQMCDFGWPITLLWVWEERRRGSGPDGGGVEGHGGPTDRHERARPGLNPGGRAGPPGWGTRQNSRFLSDTQFNSEAVFLVPRRFFSLQ